MSANLVPSAQNPMLVPNLGQGQSNGLTGPVLSPAQVLAGNNRVVATNVVTVGGTAHLADVFTLTLTNHVFPNGALVFTYTVGESDVLGSITSELANAINSSLSAEFFQLFATVSGDTLTVNQRGPVGNITVVTGAVTGTDHEGTLTPASSGVMSGGSGPIIPAANFNFAEGPQQLRFLAGQPVQLSPGIVADIVASGLPII